MRVFAFIDESYAAGRSYDGIYVLAAVLADNADESLRSAMRAMHGSNKPGKAHFHGLNGKEALVRVRAVADLQIATAVAVGNPCRHPERVRAACLYRLAVELGPRIDGLVIESRGRQPNTADWRIVHGLPARRHSHILSMRFPTGASEPILWAADTVAGAVFRALHRNTAELLDALGPVEVFDVDGT